jgi:hypothetical protein
LAFQASQSFWVSRFLISLSASGDTGAGIG